MRRPGGFSEEQVQAAIDAVAGARSPADLRAAVDEHSALSTPVVHAYLRHHRQQLEHDEHPFAGGLTVRLEGLFAILHERHHDRLIAEARGRPVNVPDPDQYVPALMRSIIDALRGRPLPLDGEVRHPQHELDAIEDDVAYVLGRSVSFPPYKPPAGSAWMLYVVECAACREPYLLARARWIDLTASPDLADDARAGRINWSACPRCGTSLCVPVREWISDAPTDDGLEALFAMWRVNSDLIVFQPPPGTQRIQTADRILEVRTERLERQHPFEPPAGANNQDGVSSRAIAYTPTELAEYISHAADSNEPNAMPFTMKVSIQELARKLREGVLALHEAEHQSRSLVPRHWPVWIPQTDLLLDDPYHYLATVLTVEAVATQADEPDQIAQIVLRRLAAAAYLRIEEQGMAERALEQAETLFDALPAPPPSLVALLLDGRGDLLRAEGRASEAARLQEESASLVLDGLEPLATEMVRLVRRTSATFEAFNAFGAHARALEMYPSLVRQWESLLSRVHRDPDFPASGARQATETFSGCLDNYAMAVKDVANALRRREVMTNAMLANGERLAALSVMPPQNHPLDDAGLLSALAATTRTTDTATAERLYEEARRLVIHALDLAESIEAWGFAAIQCVHLHQLHHVLGDTEQASAYAWKTIDHAARSGHHWEAADAHTHLFVDAIERGDTPEALAQFEAAAFQTLRGMIRIGFGATARMSQPISRMAIMLIQRDADPLRVAAVVESVRSARMANSMEQGLPGSGLDGETRAVLRDRELAQISGDGDAAKRLTHAIRERRRRRGALDERFGSWVDSTTVGLLAPSEIQATVAELGPHAMWITVVTADDTVASIAIWDEGAEAHVDTVTMPPDGAWSPQDLARVGEGLLGPHIRLDDLQRGGSLVLSLPSDLTGLPAGALIRQGRPLCTSCSPVCIHGFSMFRASRVRRRDGLGAALLVGAPHRPELTPLPGAETEVADVADLLREAGITADVLQGTAATTPAFLGVAAAYDVVHVACHANSDGLMLCAAPGEGESGWLIEDRILDELELTPGALVNLAGCRTGHAAERNGPVMQGLVPSFLVAGAGCVIASLWPIKDAATAKLQRSFYQRLTTGWEPHAALARAQADAWSGALGPDVADPAVWGAFVAYGAA